MDSTFLRDQPTTNGDDLFHDLFPTETRPALSSAPGQVDPGLSGSKPRQVIPTASKEPLDLDAQRDLKASQARLGDALPTEGWLAEFVKMAIPMTSAPTEFHLAAGLNALGSALGNRVKIRNWGGNIYPNLWTLVVAPSGNWHKTTSINMAEELLAKSGLDVSIPSDFSRESLLKQVGEKPAGLLTIDEFATLLQLGRKDYGQGILSDLTRIYDSKDEWKRALMTKEFVIRRPALSIYAATTIDYLEELVTPADLRSGFFYRFLFVTAAQKNTNRKNTDDPATVTQNRLIAGLHRLTEIAPALMPNDEKACAVLVERTPEARRLWEDWTDELDVEVESGRHAPSLAGFFQRLQTYGLKLGMIYRASACAFDPSANPLIVDEAAMKAAIACCKMVLANTIHLFEEDWADSKEARELRKVEEAIGKGCARTEAMRRLHMKKWTFDQNLDTLVETERITRTTRTNTDLGLSRDRIRPVEWLAPGPKHSTNIAKERNKPKREPNTDWEQDWDAASAAETPLVLVALPSAA
jgi:hypothetical protein